MTNLSTIKLSYQSKGISTRHLIETQVPAHIREDNPLFVKFLEYYYEFVEFDQQIVRLIQDILTFGDIDSVDLDFLVSFFEEYRILPKDIVVDQRFIAKHIYDLYQTKGTERSVKLLFKIIWGDDANLDYPSDQILRASDGRWNHQKVITVISDDVILECTAFKYRNLFFAIDYIESIDSNYRVYFTTEHRLILEESQILNFYKNVDIKTQGSVTLMPVDITVVASGETWITGQHVYLSNTPLQCIAKIVATENKGKIKSIKFLTFGDILTLPNTIDVISKFGQTVTLGINHGTVAKINGKWKTHHGIISNTETRLQDNHYYQLFSYIISSRITYKEFYPQQQKIHPAGLKCFGNFEPHINYQVNTHITTVAEFEERTLYVVDSVSPIDPVAFDMITPYNGFVVASSLREIDNYDINNQYLYYNLGVDWDEILSMSDSQQYTQEDEYITVTVIKG